MRGGWEGRGSENSSYARLYQQLASTGLLLKQGSNRILAENTAFQSPSAAASVIAGRMANGATEWKVKTTGQTYKQWEAAQL